MHCFRNIGRMGTWEKTILKFWNHYTNAIILSITINTRCDLKYFTGIFNSLCWLFCQQIQKNLSEVDRFCCHFQSLLKPFHHFTFNLQRMQILPLQFNLIIWKTKTDQKSLSSESSFLRTITYIYTSVRSHHWRSILLVLPWIFAHLIVLKIFFTNDKTTSLYLFISKEVLF